MTILLSFLKNTKNILILVLAGIVLVVGFLFLWQRISIKEKEITITGQKADIQALKESVKGLQGQIADYKKQIENQRAVAVSHQAIENDTAKLRAEIQKIKSQCTLGVNDEKIIDDITDYFNSGMFKASNSKADRKVLPATGKTNSASPRWSVRQIVDNYILVIDYALKLEKTINCYEKGE